MLDGAMTACLMLCAGRRRKLREQSSSRCAGDVKTVHQKHPEGTTHSQCQQLFPELCDRRKMWPSVLEIDSGARTSFSKTPQGTSDRETNYWESQDLGN